VLTVIFYFLVLVAYALVPGRAILLHARFRMGHFADGAITRFWAGMGWTIFGFFAGFQVLERVRQ